ncbi:hypothetical protein HGRIS_012683 [Hohenbuehelia grisea]|uniref:Uncharacterized protein n=1 Tax=Hohenbuehelia grisea TaxID=104357 RepID=A0ABR3IT20_9AGAR
MSRLEPEVIANYADGCAYVKGKLEDAFRPGGILAEKPTTKAVKDASAQAKREDVDLIVRFTYTRILDHFSYIEGP